MPRRVQRRRTRGWRKAPGDVYVGRPSRWGNPHRADDAPGGAAEAVRRFRADLLAGRLAVTPDDARRELRGRNLECWCPLDRPCHGDVLLAVANGDADAHG